jgi:hypothetical protein
MCSLVLLLMAGSAVAQTSEITCVNDSLALVSPDVIDVKLNVNGRYGSEISWADLNPSEATCYGVIAPDDLGVEASFEGEFLGSVDRVLRFVSADSGSVGTAPVVTDPAGMNGVSPRGLRVNWSSRGTSLNGVYEGSFNLANNGGFLKLTGGVGGNWDTVNSNLLATWYQLNVTALVEGSGGMLYAGVSAGSIPDSDSQGLFKNSGNGWESIGEEFFPASTIISFVQVSPDDNNLVAVGTVKDGLFVSQDGGVTFTQWTFEFDPDFAEQPVTYNVSALIWSGSKLLVALPNFGVFSSSDNANTFSRVDFMVEQDLDSNSGVEVLPVVRTFAVDPSNPDRFLAGLVFHGVWESTDGGDTWHDLYGDLNVPDVDFPGAWIYSGLEVLVDANDPQIIVVGCEQRGIYRSTNGGTNWTLVGVNAQPGNSAVLSKFSFAQSPSSPGEILAFEDNWGLIYSTDSGATWAYYPIQPSINRGYNLIASSTGQDYLLGTTYGGIYEADNLMNLSGTYTSGTSDELQDVQLGLDLVVTEGILDQQDSFDLVCQTFQGWAVWRSLSHDMDNMSLLGLYDKVNPEDCIEGYCGDESYDLMPNCFAAKKAACFNLDTPDTIRFFDQEVYEGFSYFYAVTSFDYGNTALTSPQNNTNSMVFSPRWFEDENSPYPGSGNRSSFSINSMAVAATIGEPIYVFPNPLREGVGIPGGEGETVVFTNLPEGSRVRVFTTAGDDVINLGPDNQEGMNISWDTRNRESVRVTAGVYLFKIEMPEREEFWGKLVVIR